MFTFEINYDTQIDNFGVIQFCAKTKNEAIQLFKNWCKTDLKRTDIEITNIEVVYNDADADEYGNEYLTPDDYKGE